MLVLAGGRSQRMGRPKAWLPVEDEPVLCRVAAAGLGAGIEQVVVVGSPGQPLPALPAGVERIDDPADRVHQGPLSGIAAGLLHLEARRVPLAALAACDAVFLGPEHLSFMLRTLREDRQYAAVVPETGPAEDGTRLLHPLCGAVRVGVAHQTSRALLQSGQRAARALYLGLAARRVAVTSLPEPRVVRGCNTPEQWSQAIDELQAIRS